MIRVKICGITNLEDAQAAVEAGADALGFNFWSGSPRYIRVEQAAEIIPHLAGEVSPVGVFVDAAPATIEALMARSGVRVVQLHGEEPPEEVQAVVACGIRVMKAVRVGPTFRPEQLRAFHDVAAFLLDTAVAGQRGGTGQSFDWQLAREANGYGHIVLAGGLTADNVEAAIRQARPAGVDVSSGVEIRPGQKDHVRLRQFVERALAAFSQLPLRS